VRLVLSKCRSRCGLSRSRRGALVPHPFGIALLTALLVVSIVSVAVAVGASTESSHLAPPPARVDASSAGGTGEGKSPAEPAASADAVALDAPGRPFTVGGRPVYGAEGTYRASPAAAFDGTNYLIAWEEERDGALDIFAARVSPAGAVLDPEGISVSAGPAAKTRPGVAFDGINFLVVWADSRAGSWDVYGARVSKDGAVLDPEGIAIGTGAGAQSNPAVAFSGSRYLVVWSDDSQGGWVDMRGAILDTGGSVLDDDVLVSPSVTRTVPGGPWGPSVAGDGSNFMVVWQSLRGSTWDVYCARVTPSGDVLDPAGIAVTASEEEEWYPWIASNGSQYLVVWHGISGGSYDLFAARVGTDGTLLDPQKIFVSEHRYWQRYPSVASDGKDYLVVWANWTEWTQDVHATVVTSGGEVVDILGRNALDAETDIQWRPAVVFGGDRYLVISQDERSVSGGDIYGALVSVSGESIAGDDIGISKEGDGPWRPTASFDGSNYMVVWGDVEDGVGLIAGARVSAGGSLLDATPLQVSGQDHGAYAPDIAFDGSTHLVVWQESRGGTWDVYGTRLNKLGVPLDGQGFAVSSEVRGQGRPSVAFGGGLYMVVWQDRRSGVWDVYGARVSPSGAVLDRKGLAICASSGAQRRPAVAYDGTDFVVVWEDGRNGDWDIYGARVTVDGKVLDADGVAVATGPDDDWTPEIASNGLGCLVAWQAWHGGSGDVLGTVLGPSGRPLLSEAISISDAAGRQWSPDVAFNGREYIVAWSDARRGPANVDVYASRVAPNGIVFDPGGVGADTGAFDQLLPSAAAGDMLQVLVVNSSFIPSSVFEHSRVWGSLWNPPGDRPLQLTLSIHQNPVLTSDLAIVLVPSEAVQDTSVWLTAGDEDLEVELTDVSESIYRAGYRLSGAGAVTIAAGARDLLGVAVTASRQLGAGLVSRSRGGVVNGPSGEISVRFSPSSVDKDCCVLVLPEEDSGGFTILPPSLEIGTAARLSVSLEGAASDPAAPGLAYATEYATDSDESRRTEAVPSLWREGASGWEELPSSFDEESGTLTAALTELGRFRILWGPGKAARRYRPMVIQAVPNPFHGSTSVRYMLPEAARVKVRVYDAAGRLVRTLFEGDRGPGWHGEVWDGADGAGRGVPGGIYFAVVRKGAEVAVGKCVLVR
jgi:hypothetical protein